MVDVSVGVETNTRSGRDSHGLGSSTSLGVVASEVLALHVRDRVATVEVVGFADILPVSRSLPVGNQLWVGVCEW